MYYGEAFPTAVKDAPTTAVSFLALSGTGCLLQEEMVAAHFQTRLDRALAQPATSLQSRRTSVRTMAAIAAPPRTKLNTQKSEEVSPWQA